MNVDDVAERLAQELALRKAESSSVEFVLLPEPLEGEWPLAPGSLLVVWSPNRSQLDEVKRAAEGGTEALLAALNQNIVVDTQRLPDLGDALDAVPAFGDLYYGRRTVLTGAGTAPWLNPQREWTVLVWAGDELAAEQFNATSHTAPGADPLKFLVFGNPPRLTTDEARLINAIGREAVGMGIEPMATPAAVAAVVATAVAEHYADKGLDRIDRKIANHNRAQERERERTPAYMRAQREAERIRYRNLSIWSTADEVSASPPPRGISLQQLLRKRRREVLRRERRLGEQP